MANEMRDWLKALGTLTAGSMPVEEAHAKIAAYSALLASRFPPEAYTGASLEYVGAACKFFPSYAELVEHLGAWWRDNRPREQRLPAIANDPPKSRRAPTEAEIAHVDAQLAALRADLAANRPPARSDKIQPRYLTPDQLKTRYLAEGLALPPYLTDAATQEGA
jgi:hypothetical protein